MIIELSIWNFPKIRIGDSKRYFVNAYLGNILETVSATYNIRIECFVVKEIFEFKGKQLFDPSPIMKYTMKNQSNIFVNLL